MYFYPLVHFGKIGSNSEMVHAYNIIFQFVTPRGYWQRLRTKGGIDSRPTWYGQYVKWIWEVVGFGDLFAPRFQNCFCFCISTSRSWMECKLSVAGCIKVIFKRLCWYPSSRAQFAVSQGNILNPDIWRWKEETKRDLKISVTSVALQGVKRLRGPYKTALDQTLL